MSYRTNRIISGVALSEYIRKLEAGDREKTGIETDLLDQLLMSHFIYPELIRSDDFDEFMNDRQTKLLSLIELSIGKPAYTGSEPEEGVDVEPDENGTEVERTLAMS